MHIYALSLELQKSNGAHASTADDSDSESDLDTDEHDEADERITQIEELNQVSGTCCMSVAIPPILNTTRTE